MIASQDRRIVLVDNDPSTNFEEGCLQFRLTYEGVLLAETLRSGAVQKSRAEHKHQIRKVFHRQIKRLWTITPHLKRNEEMAQSPAFLARTSMEFGVAGPDHTVSSLAERFSRFGYRFVPLATRDLGLLCNIDVLFLRYGPPGDIIRSPHGASRRGDVDNRLKTLFDALTMPRDAKEVGGFRSPDADEDPFFCLLEDDSMISRASVETDDLLEPVSNDANDVRVIITVHLRPYHMVPYNIGFG